MGRPRGGPQHLHLGLVVDGRVEQEYLADVLRGWEVRDLLGGYRNGTQLPRPPSQERARRRQRGR